MTLNNKIKKILVLFTILLAISSGCDASKETEYLDDGGLYAPNIMVNNRLYHETGVPSDLDKHDCDGSITSSVDQTELPKQDDQSNFGAGFEYDIINENRIDVYINDEWIIFEYWEN